MAFVELDQRFDTASTEYRRGNMSVRYAYSRSKDSVEENERGQDYLVFRVETDRIVFALCDGVGNSFFGGLAAQLVGESLVDWLWHVDSHRIVSRANLAGLTRELRGVLSSKVETAEEIIHRKDLSRIRSQIHRDALHNQREEHGTASNFVCGMMEPPSESCPEGLVLFFWLGDAKLRVFKVNSDRTDRLNGTWERRHGWSSLEGVVGQIQGYQGDLSVTDRVIAYSDGLRLFENQLRPAIPTSVLDHVIQQLRTRPDSDDISFIEVSVSDDEISIEDDIVERIRQPTREQVRERKLIVELADLSRIEQAIQKVHQDALSCPRDDTDQQSTVPWMKLVLGGAACLVLALLLGVVVGWILRGGYISSAESQQPSLAATEQLRPSPTAIPAFQDSPSPTSTPTTSPTLEPATESVPYLPRNAP